MTTIANTDVEGEWKAKLEGHLKSEDFFSVEKFKTSSLKFTNVTSTGDNTYNVTADITIKGKTESISFPATVSVDGAKLKATAKLTIDRSKFDVRYGSSSFFDDLGEAIDLLEQYEGENQFKNFDKSNLEGDIAQWRQFANSLRLRLAIRIVKINPALAQTQGELALNQHY